MTDDATLAALLGSRICHDLISPIGAIGNGVELLNMSGRPPSPEMQLIEESVSHASTRIRFFRIAFGSAAPGQVVGHREIVEVLENLSKSGRIRYDWQHDEDCERADAKLAFLMIQCLESSMPYGGTVEVRSNGGKWTITGTAQKMNADPDLWSVVTKTGSTAPLTPGNVHFGLAAQSIEAAGRTLSVDIAETAIQVGY